jgi:hypothetical protein
MTTTRYEYKIHPLALLFPEMSPEDYKKMKTDMELHGQIEPIMLSSDGETLLDGRNRLRACKELNIVPRVERFDPSRPYQSEADYIFAANVLRRHLTDDQRAAIANKWADAERQAAKERQKQHGGTAPGRNKNTSGESAQSVRTREAIAKKVGITPHKVRQMETVGKYLPDLVPKIQSGELKLKDAYKQARNSQKWEEHKAAQMETVAKYEPKLVPAVESGAITLTKAYRAAGLAKKKLEEKAARSVAPAKPNGTEQSEAEADAALVESRQTTKALNSLMVWLYGFERDNLATADPEEVRARLIHEGERMKSNQLEILRSCHEWMGAILRPEKAKAVGGLVN